MIVFIEIPFSAGRGAYQAFERALGPGNVGWLKKNASLEELKSDAAAQRFRVVGGRFSLIDALEMKGVTRYATVAGDPILRMLATWNAWERQPRNRQHWLPHTFNLKEAIEARILPVMEQSEALMRTLRRKGVGTEIERIVADLAALPVTVGFGDHPEAFAEAMAKALGLPPNALNPSAFAEFQRTPKNIGLIQALIDGTVPDRTLHMHLVQAADGAPVWASDA